MNSLMDQIQLERFFNLISMRTGIQISMDGRIALRDYIMLNLRSFSFSGMETYCRILELDSSESRLEWKKLISKITIGESYFFRDKGQFALLESTILPELIELRKKERTLRIWSAGCSTGEEAYSLAILVDKLIQTKQAWKILILGTDINEESIKKAENGLYGQWSFRRMEPETKNMYFKEKKDQWEIALKIRNMVVFRTVNLIEEQLPNTGKDLQNMDLILCRNMFIYFSKTAVCNVLKKLSGTLSEDGYLMTGHGELHSQDLDSLTPVIFPESVIYHKGKKNSGRPVHIYQEATIPYEKSEVLTHKKHLSDFSTEKVIPRESGSAIQSDVNFTDTNLMLADIKSLFGLGDFDRVIEKTKSLLNIDPGNFEALYFMARAYAGKGFYDDAMIQLGQLLKKDSCHTGVYLLLAQISEIQGAYENAKDFLKKVIYLDPGSVVAHLELGDIYQKEKDKVRASKMRASALKLIQTMPPEAVIEIYDGISTGELELYVKRMLEDEWPDSMDINNQAHV